MKKIEHRLIDMGRNKSWLAAEAKILPGSLSNILKGSVPSLPVALRIAKALGMTVEELWGHLIEKG